jgi:hypothetical protein
MPSRRSFLQACAAAVCSLPFVWRLAAAKTVSETASFTGAVPVPIVFDYEVILKPILHGERYPIWGNVDVPIPVTLEEVCRIRGVPFIEDDIPTPDLDHKLRDLMANWRPPACR